MNAPLRPSTSAGLSELASRFWAFLCHEMPLTAIQAGEPTADDVLMRESPADYRRRAQAAQDLLGALRQIDASVLAGEERATWRLLERELRLIVASCEAGLHLRPSLYPLGPEFAPVYWANATALNSLEDARRFLARLATVPAALAGVQESLEAGIAMGHRYPVLVLDRALAGLRATLAQPAESLPLLDPFRRSSLQGETYAELRARAWALAESALRPALQRYADFLDTQLRAVARESLACTDAPQGAEFYRLAIEIHATVPDDPEAIHQLGLSEVARLQAEMEQVAQTAGFAGDLAGFRAALSSDPGQLSPSAEALLEKIEILSKRIDARMPEFFGRLPRMTYGVRSIPENVAVGMPPAYAQPNPADGSAAGIHWVTSLPERCPAYMHVPLALHEAWPGHLMHMALMQEMQQLPGFRRHGGLRYSACLEGWALYCEWLGEEMGFYDTPQKRYGRLEMEMWRACRLVVDTGLHWKGWSREQGIGFMRANLALSEGTIAAEVDRYIGLPAQALGYQIGNRRFRAIRDRAQRELGEGFRLRDFHDALMAAGPVTLTVLEDLMQEWTACQQGRS